MSTKPLSAICFKGEACASWNFDGGICLQKLLSRGYCGTEHVCFICGDVKHGCEWHTQNKSDIDTKKKIAIAIPTTPSTPMAQQIEAFRLEKTMHNPLLIKKQTDDATTTKKDQDRDDKVIVRNFIRDNFIAIIDCTATLKFVVINAHQIASLETEYRKIKANVGNNSSGTTTTTKEYDYKAIVVTMANGATKYTVWERLYINNLDVDTGYNVLDQFGH